MDIEESGDRATAASAGSLAYESRLRRPERRTCALTPADVVRDDPLVPWLARRAPARVVVETCTEAFRIAGRAQQHGHDVRVVAATLVRALGVGQRGLKNDQRDARTLSEASCRIELPSVHIPSSVSQEVKAICVSREALIKARTQLVSRVRSYVRSRLGQPMRATPESLPKKVRRTLLQDAEGLPAHLDRLLVALETLSEQIAGADDELEESRPRMHACPAHDGARRGSCHSCSIRRRARRGRAIPECLKRRVVSGTCSGRRHDGLSHQAKTVDTSWCATSAMGAGTSRLVVVSSAARGSDGPMGETYRRATRSARRHYGARQKAVRTCSLRCGSTKRRTTRRVALAPIVAA